MYLLSLWYVVVPPAILIINYYNLKVLWEAIINHSSGCFCLTNQECDQRLDWNPNQFGHNSVYVKSIVL
jgi:hypothetical protein